MSKGIFVLIVAAVLATTTAEAFTTIQTSTSLGVYRDYQQSYHYPLYHMWNLHGIYSEGYETSLDFILNNDFSTTSQWKFFPTQAQVYIPLANAWEGAPERRSRIQLGRQYLTEGFDLALLDGAEVPFYWSPQGGFMPYAGLLRSPDMEQGSESYAPLVGLTVWENFWGAQLRGGYNARETDYSVKMAYASLLKQWDNWFFSPQFFTKQEWNMNDYSFNQSATELSLTLSEAWSLRLAHSYLNPRPTQKKEITSFIYRIFSISLTEAASLDLSWDYSENFRLELGAQQIYYNSGYQKESGQRQDLGFDFQFLNGHWLSTSLTHLLSFGGQLSDGGLRYKAQISDQSSLQLEYDLAYVEKINQVRAWLQHVRTGYERRIFDRAKAFFAVEAERNQYYEFDVRTMVYVTNYL